MKNMTHPAFILAIVGTVLIVAGLITMAHMELGLWFLYLGALLVGIFSIWSIIDIIAANHLRVYQKIFWLIIVISVPVMGGLIYYLMHQERNRIVS